MDENKKKDIKECIKENSKYMIKKNSLTTKKIILIFVLAVVLLILFEILDTKTDTAVLNIENSLNIMEMKNE